MIKIDQYTFKTTLFFTLLCLLLLVIIETFFTFLNELQDLGTSDYSLIHVASYILFDTPTRVYRIFPMALLLGALLGLGQLASNSELTAIRTAGFSKLRTIYGAIFATIFLSAIVALIGEFMIPITEQRAQEMSRKTTKGQGFWAIDGHYIVEVGSTLNGDLRNITLYEAHDQLLNQVTTASKAEIDHDSWHFPDAASTTFSDEKISKMPKKAAEIPIVIDNQALTALTSAPESLSAQKLWEFIRYLDRNGLDSSEHRLAFWSKIFHPLTNISMILIAAPLVFAQQRQKGIGERILIGVVLGLCIYLATQMLGHFILIAGFAPIIGALIPTLLAITIAFVLFRLVPN